MNDFYRKELTDYSFKELVKFAGWMNDFFSHYPNIVGGWAVWCYVKGLGSRDIDVVFLNNYTKEKALNHFFFHNNYEEVGLIEKTYVKRVKTKRGIEEITVDAYTAKDKRTIDDLKITLPWNWALKHNRKFELRRGVYIYIPTPELLLTYKLGAVLGRLEALKTLRETAYTRAKIWKDLEDIKSLVNLDLDKSLKTFLKRAGIRRHLPLVYERLPAQTTEKLKDLTK